MEYQKALEVLGLNKTASEEEIRKAHRKLSAKYHPDVNKEPGAEAKSKEISEAFAYLNSVNFTEPTQNPFGPIDFASIVEELRRAQESVVFARTRRISQDVCLDDLLETRMYDLKYQKDLRCMDCLKIEKDCSTCRNTRLVTRNDSLKFNLNPYVGPLTFKLQGKGSCYLHTGKNGNSQWVTENLLVNINVTPSKKGFWVEDNRLQKKVEIPLLTALKGGKVQVEGLWKKLTVKIPAGIKHGQVLALSGEAPNYLDADCTKTKGVFGLRVEVAYPEVTEELEKALLPKEKE